MKEKYMFSLMAPNIIKFKSEIKIHKYIEENVKMKRSQLKTPVLLIAFNRPDLTEKVFEEIRKARPKHGKYKTEN